MNDCYFLDTYFFYEKNQFIVIFKNNYNSFKMAIIDYILYDNSLPLYTCTIKRILIIAIL